MGTKGGKTKSIAKTLLKEPTGRCILDDEDDDNSGEAGGASAAAWHCSVCCFILKKEPKQRTKREHVKEEEEESHHEEVYEVIVVRNPHSLPYHDRENFQFALTHSGYDLNFLDLLLLLI